MALVGNICTFDATFIRAWQGVKKDDSTVLIFGGEGASPGMLTSTLLTFPAQDS